MRGALSGVGDFLDTFASCLTNDLGLVGGFGTPCTYRGEKRCLKVVHRGDGDAVEGFEQDVNLGTAAGR